LLFNSGTFDFVFLPITLAGYYLLGRHSLTAALTWLNAASLVFYAYGAPQYVPLIVVLIGLNYSAALLIAKTVNDCLRYWIAFVGVTGNLCVIGYYKYSGLLVSTFDNLTGSDFSIASIALPLGISFFTFQKIGYLVDTYKTRRAEPNLNRYSVFVLFFPQLIAGPIVHHDQIIPQLSGPLARRINWDDIAAGLSLFTMGLAKKVLFADTIALYSTPVFNAASIGTAITPAEAWIGALAWSLQIYFDFSGYSDMAIGLARMFGIVLPINFNSPYKATSIVEFWRRWHMTLSRFLRDYLYIPLGGNRRGDLSRYTNLMLTMLIGGLWHGAAWTFVLWGGLHGAYLIINHGFTAGVRRGVIPKLIAPLPAMFLSRALTFFAVVVAWVFFRADTWHAAKFMIGSMFNVHRQEWYGHSIVQTPLAAGLIVILLAIATIMPNTQEIMGQKIRISWLGLPPEKWSSLK
jgi:alginate O-acetyltransferase complex protein AlgI